MTSIKGKISVFVIHVEMIIYLLLFNMHDCIPLKDKIYNLFNRMQKLCEIVKHLHSIFKVYW